MVPVLMGAVGDILALGAFEAGNSGAVSDLSPSIAGLKERAGLALVSLSLGSFGFTACSDISKHVSRHRQVW